MNFAVGSLVKARGREWVILPESDQQMLVLRPLGGRNEEVTGIYLPLENVEPAQFRLPNPAQWGDDRSCRLLRNAIRFGFRSSAGPFRSFARIAVEPRPYQLVPLMMALRLDPVRMLIADDVGIGKTIEAGLIARELLDRHEVERLAVLCPPHLAEQWQAELQEKFHLDAVLVLSSTVNQLERACARDESLFAHYPYIIISTDFIKANRRRDDFVRACPELVIVDEAHTCAFAGEGRSARHQRYQLISRLAADKQRLLILVTATPHSGNEAAFRSLLTFLDEDFRDLPQDLAGKQNEYHRKSLAKHFIQRRRGDIRSYLQSETPFPRREDAEDYYMLKSDYRQLVDKIMNYAREKVKDTSVGQARQRVRWWSVLALLRSMASSPAAAVATLRNRAQAAGAETVEEADRLGRHTVLDLTDSDATEVFDVIPGSAVDDEKTDHRLLAMAAEAEALKGEKDTKLQRAIKILGDLVKEGYQPIVFCRFIPTAEYVAQEVRQYLPKVEVAAVTGQLPPAEREKRVMQLTTSHGPITDIQGRIFTFKTKRFALALQHTSNELNEQKHADPAQFPLPRYWIHKSEFSLFAEKAKKYLLGFRNITGLFNLRSAVFSIIPASPCGHSIPVVLLNSGRSSAIACLLTCFSSFIFDYIARQKMGGINLSFFILKQLPVLPPETYRVWREKEEKQYGEYRTKRVILEIYDEMQKSLAANATDQTQLDPLISNRTLSSYMTI